MRSGEHTQAKDRGVAPRFPLEKAGTSLGGSYSGKTQVRTRDLNRLLSPAALQIQTIDDGPWFAY